MSDDTLVIAGRELTSRLVMGTGGAPSLEVLEEALVASGTQLTTVALRRLDPNQQGSVLDVLRKHDIAVLPNTAGCFTTGEAVLTPGVVRTVSGDVPARELDRTNYHEHLFQVSPLLPGDELDDEALLARKSAAPTTVTTRCETVATAMPCGPTAEVPERSLPLFPMRSVYCEGVEAGQRSRVGRHG